MSTENVYMSASGTYFEVPLHDNVALGGNVAPTTIDKIKEFVDSRSGAGTLASFLGVLGITGGLTLNFVHSPEQTSQAERIAGISILVIGFSFLIIGLGLIKSQQIKDRRISAGAGQDQDAFTIQTIDTLPTQPAQSNFSWYSGLVQPPHQSVYLPGQIGPNSPVTTLQIDSFDSLVPVYTQTRVPHIQTLQ